MLGVELVVCLQHLDLGDREQRWSRKQLGRLASLPGWKKVVSCLCEWQRASLEAVTKVQLGEW